MAEKFHLYYLTLNKGQASTSKVENTITRSGDNQVGSITLLTKDTFVDRNIVVSTIVNVPQGTITATKTESTTYSAKEITADDDAQLYVNKGWLDDTAIQLTKATLSNTGTSTTYLTVDDNNNKLGTLQKESDNKYWLYINGGWIQNTKVELGHLIPGLNSSGNPATADYIITGKHAFDLDGNELTGTMAKADIKYTGGTVTVTPQVTSSSTITTSTINNSGLSFSPSALWSKTAVEYSNSTTGAFTYLEHDSNKTYAGTAQEASSAKEDGTETYIESITIKDGKSLGVKDSSRGLTVTGYDGTTSSAVYASVSDGGTVNVVDNKENMVEITASKTSPESGKSNLVEINAVIKPTTSAVISNESTDLTLHNINAGSVIVDFSAKTTEGSASEISGNLTVITSQGNISDMVDKGQLRMSTVTIGSTADIDFDKEGAAVISSDLTAASDDVTLLDGPEEGKTVSDYYALTASTSATINTTGTITRTVTRGWINEEDKNDITFDVNFESETGTGNTVKYIKKGSITIASGKTEESLKEASVTLGKLDGGTNVDVASLETTNYTHYITIRPTVKKGSVTPYFTATEGYVTATGEPQAGTPVELNPSVEDTKFYIKDGSVDVTIPSTSITSPSISIGVDSSSNITLASGASKYYLTVKPTRENGTVQPVYTTTAGYIDAGNATADVVEIELNSNITTDTNYYLKESEITTVSYAPSNKLEVTTSASSNNVTLSTDSTDYAITIKGSLDQDCTVTPKYNVSEGYTEAGTNKELESITIGSGNVNISDTTVYLPAAAVKVGSISVTGSGTVNVKQSSEITRPSNMDSDYTTDQILTSAPTTDADDYFAISSSITYSSGSLEATANVSVTKTGYISENAQIDTEASAPIDVNINPTDGFTTYYIKMYKGGFDSIYSEADQTV